MNLDVPGPVVIFQAFPVLIKLLQAVLSHLVILKYQQFGPLIDLNELNNRWNVPSRFRTSVYTSPSFRQCAGSRFSCLQRIKSSIYHIYQQSFSSVPRQKEPIERDTPLYSLQLSPEGRMQHFQRCAGRAKFLNFGIELWKRCRLLVWWDDLLPSL